jgi:hypothetical protein
VNIGNGNTNKLGISNEVAGSSGIAVVKPLNPDTSTEIPMTQVAFG